MKGVRAGELTTGREPHSQKDGQRMTDQNETSELEAASNDDPRSALEKVAASLPMSQAHTAQILREAVRRLRERASDAEGMRDYYKDQVDTVLDERNAAQVKLNARIEEVTGLRADVAGLKQQIERRDETIEALRGRVRHLEGERQTQISTIADLSDRADKAVAERNQVWREKADEKLRGETLSGELERLEEEVARLTAERDEARFAPVSFERLIETIVRDLPSGVSIVHKASGTLIETPVFIEEDEDFEDEEDCP